MSAEFAVLLSCASSAVHADLVEPQRFATAQAASEAGRRWATASGLEYATMRRADSGDPWLEVGTGRTPVEAIRHHWGQS